MSDKYHYTVYGLHLIADHPLPEALPAASLESDITPISIHMVEDVAALPMQPSMSEIPYYTHPYQDENGVPALQVYRDDVRYYLAYLNGNLFVVSRDGNSIWAAWPKETDFGFVTAQILGPILGLILQLRGALVLHASVVVYNGQALALLGGSGAGKSTTAAELCRQGCQGLSDDIAALHYQDDRWWVQPGYPRLRLWPESAETLYGPEHDLRQIAPGIERWDKRYLELDRGPTSFCSSPQPLGAIYAIDWSDLENDKIQIKPLSSTQALAALDGNSFMGKMLDRDQRQQQIAAVAKILDSIPIQRVQPTYNLAEIPTLALALLEVSKNISE